MTAKEYLNQAYRLNELIQSHQKELEQLNDIATKVTAGLNERVSSSGVSDKVGATATKIVALQDKIKDEIDKLVDLKTEIHTVIEQVENKDERLLLRLRYIEYMRWEEIATRMNFSYRNATRVHAEALKHVKIPNL